jgi:hypothetical protein
MKKHCVAIHRVGLMVPFAQKIPKMNTKETIQTGIEPLTTMMRRTLLRSFHQRNADLQKNGDLQRNELSLGHQLRYHSPKIALGKTGIRVDPVPVVLVFWKTMKSLP